MSEQPEPQIMVPQMCEKHMTILVNALKLRPSDPWRAHVVVANLMLFQWASSGERIWKRAGDDSANLSLVLAEIGCLACYEPEGFKVVKRLIRDKGLSYASKVSRREIIDPAWVFK